MQDLPGAAAAEEGAAVMSVVIHKLRQAPVRQILGEGVECPWCFSPLRHGGNGRSYCDLCCRRVTPVDVLVVGQGMTPQQVVEQYKPIFKEDAHENH